MKVQKMPKFKNVKVPGRNKTVRYHLVEEIQDRYLVVTGLLYRCSEDDYFEFGVDRELIVKV